MNDFLSWCRHLLVSLFHAMTSLHSPSCAAKGDCSLCIHMSLRLSFRLSFVFLDNRGSSGLETWICYEVGGIDGKIRLWSGAARGSWRNGRLP